MCVFVKESGKLTGASWFDWKIMIELDFVYTGHAYEIVTQRRIKGEKPSVRHLEEINNDLQKLCEYI